MTTRPAADEFADFYKTYVDKVSECDIVDYLTAQIEMFNELLSSVTEDRGSYRYEDGKWSIKEVVGHVIDTERVFAVRALAFARNDSTNWPGIEQDDYVAAADFDRRLLGDLAEEFVTHRKSFICLLKSLSDDEFMRRGVASECEFTVRAIAFITAGHFQHHLDVLKDRYL